jgi:hypothetical protein
MPSPSLKFTGKMRHQQTPASADALQDAIDERA